MWKRCMRLVAVIIIVINLQSISKKNKHKAKSEHPYSKGKTWWRSLNAWFVEDKVWMLELQCKGCDVDEVWISDPYEGEVLMLNL